MCEFYGPKRFNIPIKQFDIVFTTYDILTQDHDEPLEKKTKQRRTNFSGMPEKPKKEFKPKAPHKRKKLFNDVEWHRVVLDEGHKIGNKDTRIS